jgi:Domain of unknown function (DUF1707)
MAGSGDEPAARAADRNLLRASDADRKQVIAVLKSAFTQGRLTKDEFDLRVGQVFVSRTYTDLDVLSADILAGPAKAQQSEPARQPNSKKPIRRGSAVAAGATVVISVIMVATSPHPVADFIIMPVIGSIIIVLIAEFSSILSWVLDKLSWALGENSGRQPSQGPSPSARGTTYRPLTSADSTRSPSQMSQEPPHTVEAGRSRLPHRGCPVCWYRIEGTPS